MALSFSSGLRNQTSWTPEPWSTLGATQLKPNQQARRHALSMTRDTTLVRKIFIFSTVQGSIGLVRSCQGLPPKGHGRCSQCAAEGSKTLVPRLPGALSRRRGEMATATTAEQMAAVGGCVTHASREARLQGRAGLRRGCWWFLIISVRNMVPSRILRRRVGLRLSLPGLNGGQGGCASLCVRLWCVRGCRSPSTHSHGLNLGPATGE